MPSCYHCGEEFLQEDLIYCPECGQHYCKLHINPIDHECKIVQESLGISNESTPQADLFVNQQNVISTEEQSSQEHPIHRFTPSNNVEDISSAEMRGTTDGSFTWYRKERHIPENAFDPDSGIEFKGIMLPHKSEFFHLLIGGILIFTIGVIGFYNPLLVKLKLTWTILLLASFYTTAFLFHEFGHRQVAKHFGLQTKFRLLTFGMVLTLIGLATGVFSLLFGLTALPTIALPGAVVVLGLNKIDRKTGLCKAAGPTVNLVYGSILLAISFFIPKNLYPLNLFVGVAASLNFMLGLFNMIPVGILDGQNIFKWNKGIYFLLFSALAILLIITYFNIYAPIQTNPYVPESL
ncbi:MAG: hypothetical protein GF383_08360 [Candidatus Lokiarchaeota archaeon]|nr:hypothetical protein [Candidatus Lokiarchaeota archaeon]MBD3340366.1 hypothetical protein [Candidatus Lokiarchaeota archaeon]